MRGRGPGERPGSETDLVVYAPRDERIHEKEVRGAVIDRAMSRPELRSATVATAAPVAGQANAARKRRSRPRRLASAISGSREIGRRGKCEVIAPLSVAPLPRNTAPGERHCAHPLLLTLRSRWRSATRSRRSRALGVHFVLARSPEATHDRSGGCLPGACYRQQAGGVQEVLGRIEDSARRRRL